MCQLQEWAHSCSHAHWWLLGCFKTRAASHKHGGKILCPMISTLHFHDRPHELISPVFCPACGGPTTTPRQAALGRAVKVASMSAPRDGRVPPADWPTSDSSRAPSIDSRTDWSTDWRMDWSAPVSVERLSYEAADRSVETVLAVGIERATETNMETSEETNEARSRSEGEVTSTEKAIATSPERTPDKSSETNRPSRRDKGKDMEQ